MEFAQNIDLQYAAFAVKIPMKGFHVNILPIERNRFVLR